LTSILTKKISDKVAVIDKIKLNVKTNMKKALWILTKVVVIILISVIVIAINSIGYRIIVELFNIGDESSIHAYNYYSFLLCFPFLIFNLIYCSIFFVQKNKQIFSFFKKIYKSFLLVIVPLLLLFATIDYFLNKSLREEVFPLSNYEVESMIVLFMILLISLVLYLLFSVTFIKLNPFLIKTKQRLS